MHTFAGLKNVVGEYFVKLCWVGMPSVAKDPADLSTLKDDAILPGERERIMGWAYVHELGVGETSRVHRTYALLYTPPAVPYPVAVRIQGFVSYHELTALGNWDMYASTSC